VVGQPSRHSLGGDGATAERDDTVVFGQRRPHDLFLDAAELLLAVFCEDVGDGPAGGLDDLISVSSNGTPIAWQPATDRRLAEPAYRPERLWAPCDPA